MKQLNYLTGLRGLAAVTVMLGHIFEITTLHNPQHGYLDPLGILSTSSVPTFIVLSGYLLSLPIIRDGYLKKGVVDFYTRRANRILPAYLFSIAFGLTVAVLVIRETTWYEVFLPSFWAAVFLMHDFIDQAPEWNRPLWSMPIEWHIYFVAPLLFLAWRKTGVIKGSMIAMAVAFWGISVCNHFNLAYADLEFYALFVMGGCAAYIVHSDRDSAKALRSFPHWMAISVGLAFCYFVAAAGWDHFYQYPMIGHIAWGPIASMGLVGLSQPSRISAFLGAKGPVAVGDISYSLYLTHWPVITAIMSFLPHWPDMVSLGVVLVCGVPAALLVAKASWFVFERPYLERKGKQGAAIPQPSGAATATPPV